MPPISSLWGFDSPPSPAEVASPSSGARHNKWRGDSSKSGGCRQALRALFRPSETALLALRVCGGLAVLSGGLGLVVATGKTRTVYDVSRAAGESSRMDAGVILPARYSVRWPQLGQAAASASDVIPFRSLARITT